MIIPLKTALLVSQRSTGEVFGESFISKKDFHSLSKKSINSWSLAKTYRNAIWKYTAVGSFS